MIFLTSRDTFMTYGCHKLCALGEAASGGWKFWKSTYFLSINAESRSLKYFFSTDFWNRLIFWFFSQLGTTEWERGHDQSKRKTTQRVQKQESPLVKFQVGVRPSGQSLERRKRTLTGPSQKYRCNLIILKALSYFNFSSNKILTIIQNEY